jgi:peptidyl-prolyl cis-trans isomerase A (cyclophilin A)
MRALCLVPLALVLACDQGVLPPKEAPKLAEPPPKPPAPIARPPTAEDLAAYTNRFGQAGTLTATLETTHGTITCELYADKAPMTVANFVGLATGQKPWLDTRDSTGPLRISTPFYDGLTFHRVIPGFMIQGGDPVGSGAGGPGYKFDNEIWEGAHFVPGSLGMANAGTHGGRGTNGSQFFIMETDARPDLDKQFTVFGQCGELDVIKAIARVERDPQDKPVEPVRINKVTIAKR